MKRKIELIIYTIIFCLFGVLFVSTQSLTYFYYSLALWISFGVLMMVSRYLITPKILNRQFGYSIIIFSVTFSICFLITGYLSARYLSEMFKIDSVSYSEKVLLKDTIPYLIIAAIIGLLHLFKLKRNIGKKILYWITGFAIIVIIGFSIKYFSDISYKGNKEIILLNSGEPYTSLQDILSRPQFKNKIVYVDIWGTYCGPCLNEFENYTPQLTQRYKNEKDIAFLYICIDSHPLPERRWKDRIKRFKPNGYHVLVDVDEEAKLSNEIFGTALEGKFFPYVPCYLIVNRSGEIIERPTINMEKMELGPSDTTLLYNRLDSLRRL